MVWDKVMEEKPRYLGHRERLRRRFRQAGIEGMHDYEILELLLTYAIPRRDVKPLAKELLRRFGSLSGVLDASFEELEAVPELGPASATLIRLVKETCSAYLAEEMQRRDFLTSPQAVVDFARAKLAGRPNEAFMVVYLNTKNGVIAHEVLHEGTVDRSVVYPRRVVERALAHHASGLVLIHNHPSGDPQPSPEDKHITQAVVAAARTVDLRVLDHVIVGKDSYFSFMEGCLL